MSAVNSESLKVALVQSDIVWLQPKQNLDNLTMKLQHIESVDLILLPETFATGFAINLDVAEAEQGPVFNWMQTQAKEHNTVVAGSVLVEQQGKKANRFYWCWPDGRFEFYDKRHLFCLGKEGDYVRAGDSRKVFTIKGFRLLPQICYDLRFPVFQRNHNDYDVMVNVANWPAARRRGLCDSARLCESHGQRASCTWASAATTCSPGSRLARRLRTRNRAQLDLEQLDLDLEPLHLLMQLAQLCVALLGKLVEELDRLQQPLREEAHRRHRAALRHHRARGGDGSDERGGTAQHGQHRERRRASEEEEREVRRNEEDGSAVRRRLRGRAISTPAGRATARARRSDAGERVRRERLGHKAGYDQHGLQGVGQDKENFRCITARKRGEEF